MRHASKSLGAEVHFWDLDVKPLPLVGEDGCWENENVKEFQELATQCDAFLLSSPEYHGTMSGAMKNTLDWLYSKHVKGKVFGLMSTLGGAQNSNTLMLGQFLNNLPLVKSKKHSMMTET